MKDKASKAILIIILFVVLVNPVLAQVAEIWQGTDCNQSGAEPCDFCDALVVIQNIVNFITQAAFVIAALFITIGAVMIMVGGANEETFKKGKSSLTNALIGLFIALSAWLIVNTVLNILAPDMAADGAAPWNQIDCSMLQ